MSPAHISAFVFGYRVHTTPHGHCWTLMRPGWTGPEVDRTHHATEGEAWQSAIAAHKAELARPTWDDETVPLVHHQP